MEGRRSPSLESVPCAPPTFPPPDAATAEVHVAIPATMPVAQGASADVSPKRDNQGRGSSCDDEGNYQGTVSCGQRLLTPWLSWNPGPALGPDPSLLASHLNGPWHVCDGLHFFVIPATCLDAVKHLSDCHSSFSCNKREPFLRAPFLSLL